MKSLRKTHLVLALGLAITNTAIASDTQSSAYYPSLHNSQQASDAYEKFLNGGAVDPFAELNHGYKDGYAQDVDTNIRPQQYELLRERSVEQFESNAAYFSNISSARDRQRSALYEQSFNEDGEFDAAAYAELYADLLSSQKEEIDNHIDDGSDNLISIMDENNSALNSLSSSVSDQTKQATANLVNAMGAKSHQKKNSMYDLYSASLNNASLMAEQASSTIAVASSFLDDCGGACSFPEQPPAVDPEDPPEEPPTYNPPPNIDCFGGRGSGWRWDDTTGMRIYYKCP